LVGWGDVTVAVEVVMNQYYGSYNLREGVAFPLQQRWL
jgi:hypothetical protein